MNESKALILAAGPGTRLSPITDDKPKSLVPVCGKPILIKQIENLKLNGIENITIGAGHKADVLERTVRELYPETKIVVSANYAATNNMYSAYLGIKSMFPNGKVGAFYMMNADVFFDSSVISALAEDARENLVVVDVGRYEAESMKVVEKDGRLVEISKQVPESRARGCSIDVYKFGADGGAAFFRRCVEYVENRKELKLWSEVALNDAFADEIFRACPLRGRWTEIDTREDLAAAELLFAERAGKI